jgi:hypothetical protein
MPRINTLNIFNYISVIGSGEPEQANYQGATMVFVLNGTPPTGWVKDTSDNDYTLRCVTGSVSSGGSVAFTTAMTSQSLTGSIPISGAVGGTSLNSTQIPAHNHGPYPANTLFRNNPRIAPGTNNASRSFSPALETSTITPTAAGKGPGQAGDAHTHTVSGTPGVVGPVTFATVNLAVRYVDAILATRT